MKKIILVILMFISVNVFSQTLTTYYSFKTYPTSTNKNIYWYGVNFSRIDSVLHLLSTGSSFDLTAFHSFSGINNFTNGTTFSDSVRMTRLSVDTLTITSGKIPFGRLSDSLFKLSNLDTTRFLDLSDTSTIARTTTGTTESFLSQVLFSALVTFQTTSPVFNIAAVFNVLQNFANGLTTTTLTASGTATFNGDMVPTWVKNNSSVTAYQYEKIKIIAFKLGTTTATTYTAPHGITDWHTIKSYTVSIMDDSSNTLIMPSVSSDDAGSQGKVYNNTNIDSLNCRLRLSSTSVNLVSDSAFFRIIYTDPNR